MARKTNRTLSPAARVRALIAEGTPAWDAFSSVSKAEGFAMQGSEAEVLRAERRGEECEIEAWKIDGCQPEICMTYDGAEWHVN